MAKILTLIGCFVFLYPFYMSIVWMLGGIIFSFRRERGKCPALRCYPFFSIIIPAHNEEKIIEETVGNLKNLHYPHYEVILVNDGSTDKTPEIAERLVSENPNWLRVINVTPNSGKSKALNIGILVSKGEFILTIDADCLLDRHALRWMAWHFTEYPQVGAVTGNPRVRNRTSLLGKIQVGEYSNIIGLIKRTQRILGKVLTVSGVMAAYRKSALIDCGLFDSNTVTEDIDITWKLQKNFWDIRYEPHALSWILVPETLKGLWQQRVRWAQGGVEVLVKHVDVWFHFKYRRLWPLYLEYFVGVFWAHCFISLVVLWLFFLLANHFCYFYFLTFCPTAIEIDTNITSFYNPLFPKWYGAILGLACLLEFFTSFIIDIKYEKKSFFKYYFWVVWYPVVYWVLSALAAINGFLNVIFHRKGISSIWVSPDRGLQAIK